MKLPVLGGVIALAVILVDQIVKAGVLAHFDRVRGHSNAFRAVP